MWRAGGRCLEITVISARTDNRDCLARHRNSMASENVPQLALISRRRGSRHRSNDKKTQSSWKLISNQRFITYLHRKIFVVVYFLTSWAKLIQEVNELKQKILKCILFHPVRRILTHLYQCSSTEKDHRVVVRFKSVHCLLILPSLCSTTSTQLNTAEIG